MGSQDALDRVPPSEKANPPGRHLVGRALHDVFSGRERRPASTRTGPSWADKVDQGRPQQDRRVVWDIPRTPEVIAYNSEGR